jgi:ubiquinone/menaquinone biosynthesis C-methylase UbiE
MEDSFLFTMHEGLPRQGPGSTACTKKMYSLIPKLPENPVILDIGCGSGMQTIDLAHVCPKARITAVDIYPPFLQGVKERANTAGVSHRIRTVQASMDNLPFPPSSYDLIWAEGSIFILGAGTGITA